MKTMIRRIFDSFNLVSGRRYYSQLGEDAVLSAYFHCLKLKPSRVNALLGNEAFEKGFYVEVGAYSPKRGSNTYYFYERGWRGITVEPNIAAKKWFQLLRRRDIHVTAAISAEDGHAFYYSGGYDATNYIATENSPKAGFASHKIQTLTLKSLFDKHVPKDTEIDILSVDCEGHDLMVLKSNDWNIYRPRVVVAEVSFKSESTDFMLSQGYEPFSWTLASVLFKRSK